MNPNFEIDVALNEHLSGVPQHTGTVPHISQVTPDDRLMLLHQYNAYISEQPHTAAMQILLQTAILNIQKLLWQYVGWLHLKKNFTHRPVISHHHFFIPKPSV